jgi:hypothetical protein
MPEHSDGENGPQKRVKRLIQAMEQDGTDKKPSDFTDDSKAVIAALSDDEFEALLSMRHKFNDKEALKKFDGFLCIIF